AGVDVLRGSVRGERAAPIPEAFKEQGALGGEERSPKEKGGVRRRRLPRVGSWGQGATDRRSGRSRSLPWRCCGGPSTTGRTCRGNRRGRCSRRTGCPSRRRQW